METQYTLKLDNVLPEVVRVLNLFQNQGDPGETFFQHAVFGLSFRRTGCSLPAHLLLSKGAAGA
jgi:hypothetical protein